MRLAFLSLSLVALTAPAAAQSGGAFTVVRTDRSYPRLADAVAAIGGGDGTIRIAPGRYRDCAVQEAGSVTYRADRPGTVVFDGAICEGKATLVLRGRKAEVDGIVFTHDEVLDGNGAGIRIEKGDLVVRNAMFIDSQSGILSASDPSSSVTIDRSTFSGLGKDPTGNGAHAIYIGDYGALTVTRSRFERGTGGHYVKSRAPRVQIVDNSFDDSRGHHTNYMIDLSNGASGRIAENSFLQGPDKDNYSTMISVAPEGAENSSAGLVVERNRAWLAPDFDNRTTFVGNWSDDDVAVRDNDLAERITPLADR
ncbi:right-handed parallel beta-helix repeat-containing protein [Stakelama saccharophila]|uniref:Right-handed parallel beta-helix repeat-containing protein n=1 Tax=Stakelama saccharophila TaxID=3075605 RepID=A0ABZ0B7B0_9SPHN|nr:right-handed parallel beta-helix repeat-containing protein [Stakelama sp. W311]WNO53301.1 right-handed parallel beta-helix repeat-containing protein [Stakelama sp. W311]